MEFAIPNLKEEVYRGSSFDVILFSKESADKEQEGYSISKEGDPLYGFNEGDWQEGWFVIGYEDSCGDPIFIDLNDPGIPVYTASHGVGRWNEILLAESYDEFIQILKGRDSYKEESVFWLFFYGRGEEKI